MAKANFFGMLRLSSADDPVGMLRRATAMVGELVSLGIPMTVTVSVRHIDGEPVSPNGWPETPAAPSNGNGTTTADLSPSERRKSFTTISNEELRRATIERIKGLAHGDEAPTLKGFEANRGLLPSIATITTRLDCTWNNLVEMAGFTARPLRGGRPRVNSKPEPEPDPESNGDTNHGKDTFSWHGLADDLRPIVNSLNMGVQNWSVLSMADRRGLALHAIRVLAPEDRKLSIASFNDRRPPWMPPAADLMTLFDLRWIDLVRSATR